MNIASVSTFNKEEEEQAQNFSKKEILLNQIKWSNIILVFYSTFQFVFFIGFTFVSFIILLLSYYISFKLWKVLNFESRKNFNFVITNTDESQDINFTRQSILTIQSLLTMTMFLCVIDLILASFTMGEDVWKWFTGYAIWLNKFAQLTILLLIGRFGILGNMYFMNKKFLRAY